MANGRILGRFNLSSMANTLALVLFIIIFVIFSTLGTFIYTYTRGMILKQQESIIQTKTQAIVGQLDALFKEKGTLVKQMSTNKLFQNYIETTNSPEKVKSSKYAAETEATLASIVKTDPFLLDTWVAGIAGNGFWLEHDGVASKPDFKIQGRPYFKGAVEANGVYFSDPYVDIATGNLQIGIFYPVKDDKSQLIGFTVADISMKDMPAIMQSYTLGSTGYSMLLSKTGDILYHPDKNKVLKEKLNENKGDMGEVAKRMIAGESGLELINDNGERRYIGYATSKETGWSVGLTISEKEVLAGLKTFTTITIGGFVISLILLVLISYVTLRYILRSIPHLLAKLKLIENGDLTVQFDMNSKNEIGQISRGMRSMVLQIYNMIQMVSNTSQVISQTSHELKAISSQTVATMNETAVAIDEIAKATNHQSSEADTILRNAVEFSDQIKAISTDTKVIEDMVQKAKEQSGNGLQVVGELSKWSEENNKSSQAMSAIIHEIDTSREEISNFLKTINQIAQQTNLLALNASIEAARAGDHGKGFAVVAAEVRKLAEQTAAATQEINKKVHLIEEKTTVAVHHVTQGLSIAEENAKSVENTKRVFHHFNDDLELLKSRITYINQGSTRINRNKDEIVHALQTISASTEENSASSEEVAASAQLQLESIDKVANLSDQLNQISEKLQLELKQFRTD